MRALRPHALALIALALVAIAVLGTYFLNSPHAVIEFDSWNSVGTPTYIGTAQALLQGHVFSTGRLPGYPFLLAMLGGAHGYYVVVLALQSLMFVAVVGATYWIAFKAFERRWIAFVVALLLATDVYVAAYSKEILSESLAMALVTGMLATLVIFARRPAPRLLWILALLALLVALTRSEWVFFPLAIAMYFAIWAVRRPLPRGVVLHGLAALVACYAAIGLYVAGNAAFNGFWGTSEINNISLLGKVMQYDMQLEAPPQYHDQALLVDRYVNVLHLNVWHVVTENPSFASDHYALAGAFGRAVILRDPVKFAGLSARLALTENADVDEPLLHVAADGTFRLPLRALAHYTSARYAADWLLPALAVLWFLFPLVYRRPHALEAMGPVALVALYGTVIIAVGGFDEFGRYHTVFIPAVVLLVWGTLLLNVEIAAQAKNRLGPATAGLIAAELVAFVAMAIYPRASLAAILCLVVLCAQGGVVWLSLRAADSVPR
jgi:hypothetical protein